MLSMENNVKSDKYRIEMMILNGENKQTLESIGRCREKYEILLKLWMWFCEPKPTEYD